MNARQSEADALRRLGGTRRLAESYLSAVALEAGRTMGKRVMGLRVVQESEAQISLGPPVVRQLPVLFQVFWIDVLFALFTERNQRAFELRQRRAS